MNRFSILSATIVFAAFTMIASTALAVDETDDFTVSASVVASCSITAGDLAFGDYDPVEGADVTATSTIDVACSNGAGWEVKLSTGAAADFTVREMSDGVSGTLEYNLFTEALHSNVWGDTSGGTASATGTGSGSSQQSTVYGLILAGQSTVPVGAYTDTITATVTY